MLCNNIQNGFLRNTVHLIEAFKNSGYLLSAEDNSFFPVVGPVTGLATLRQSELHEANSEGKGRVEEGQF
jgi:hypothetical protein